MDLITIILVVGSLVNGVLLTLCMRYAREARDVARRAAGCARNAELEAACSNAWFGRMASKLDMAIAALPKKRKPRAKAEVPGEASHQALTDSALAEGTRNERS